MTPQETAAYNRAYYQKRKTVLRARRLVRYADNITKEHESGAEYREKNRDTLRLQRKLKLPSMCAAREVALVAELSPVAHDSAGDDYIPSASETPQDRIAKDHWRAKLVDGFMHALKTRDFGPFQRSDSALRRLVGQAPERASHARLTDHQIENIMRLAASGQSSGAIGALLDIPDTTVRSIVQREKRSKAMSLSVIVQRNERAIADFDASGRLVMSSTTEPDNAMAIVVALRRALACAEATWAKAKLTDVDKLEF